MSNRPFYIRFRGIYPNPNLTLENYLISPLDSIDLVELNTPPKFQNPPAKYDDEIYLTVSVQKLSNLKAQIKMPISQGARVCRIK